MRNRNFWNTPRATGKRSLGIGKRFVKMAVRPLDRGVKSIMSETPLSTPTVRGGLGRLASFLGGERGARNVLYYG